MLDLLYAYALAGFLTSSGVTAGLLLCSQTTTAPIKTFLWLQLIWPLVIFSAMKYLLFTSWQEEEDDSRP